MSEETTIYESEGIKVTNLRAVFAEKTYSVANITSVETKEIAPSGCLPIGLVIFGIFSIIGGISSFQDNWAWLIWGAIAIGLFVAVNKNSRSSWAVNLTTASGEVKAYTSQDQETIKKIVDALNDAIVKKG